MSEWIKLKASDGHELSAYVARPEGMPLGAIVLLQEIFGVNFHIRSVADGYARDGYLVVAPALFDRLERGVELKYESKEGKKGYALRLKLSIDLVLLDIAAAFEHVRGTGKGTAVLGYCFGGFLSWLSATRGKSVKMDPKCCVGYYPGGIGDVAAEKPACPVMLHFGAKDEHIGNEQIDAVRNAHHANVEVYVYEGAEHGFNCDARSSFHAPSAKLARERSLAFLKKYIA